MRQALQHPQSFKTRRFLNWFPLGLSYALLYMGRYNLTVAKTSLGAVMTKEDFGIIFGVGTFVYALSFLFNGPLVDRRGGRFGMLVALIGSCISNILMGVYLSQYLSESHSDSAQLRTVFSVLYGLNMYFQSFAAVSIVKVNAHWFHVSERGGFSGVFGTMISSGIFLAFTVNGWLMDLSKSWWPEKPQELMVFYGPGIFLSLILVLEFFILRDLPSQAGMKNFDTGDASSGDTSDAPLKTLDLYKKILTNPIILTIAGIEFCTGVLRNGVMHWFPIYAQEIWVLPGKHWLRYGAWEHPALTVGFLVASIVCGLVATRFKGRTRAYWVGLAMLAFVSPFMQAGWGGILFVAGVLGGNIAGWVSDWFFDSRRAPSAGGLYALLAICTVGMIFTLAPPTTVVKEAKSGLGLQPGDRILKVAGRSTEGWADIVQAVVCVRPSCVDSMWNEETCKCETTRFAITESTQPEKGSAVIPVTVVRNEQEMVIDVPDPLPRQRAGDKRSLAAQPELPMSPFWLGALVVIMSLCVIGSHGLLSGTATMDFGGRKGAATAVGVIDGFVYAGTAVQSVSLGYLTSKNWNYWPVFLVPFAILGVYLLTRIWHAKPSSKKH